MRAVLLRPRNGDVMVEDVPAPILGPGRVLIRNEYSLISAGTERARVEVARQGLLGKARSRPDQVRQALNSVRQVGLKETFDLVNSRLDEPVPMGYSCAGVVLDVAPDVDDIVAGSRVAAGGAGYANHAEVVSVPKNLVVRLPESVSARQAAFVTVGAIALQAIHQADVPPGSRVAVIGLGLVGQLTVRLLRAYGYDVVAVDTDASTLELAAAAGVPAVRRGDGELIDRLPSIWRQQGADAVVIAAATTSTDPIDTAGQIARDRGVVVILGDVAVEPPRETYYGKELVIRFSRSYGPGRYDPEFEERGRTYPAGYVPWTERRNMAEVVRLLAEGRLDVESLSPAEYPVAEAAAAYEALSPAGGTGRAVAVLLSYPRKADSTEVLPVQKAHGYIPSPPPLGPGEPVRFGVVGAGAFPTRKLFPHLKRSSNAQLAWLVTGGGLTAKHQGSRWGFGRLAGRLEEGLSYGDAHCVLVLTRHDSHARLAAEVLRAGVAVYLEKPLGLSEPELEDLAEAWISSGRPAMAGFNRRFAPAIRDLKRELAERSPIQVSYRVFAGRLPSSHWSIDPAHGGRLLGEVCHFVDTAGYLIGAPPVSVRAMDADGGNGPAGAQSVTAWIEYADGSAASILYAGRTPAGAPKEMLEVAADGLAARVDDFRVLRVWGAKTRARRYRGMPKGHREEMEELVNVVRGTPSPEADFALALHSSLTTIRLARSITAGNPVDVIPEGPWLRSALGVPAPRLPHPDPEPAVP